jgi:phage repressor protein C with HTH and peptisase S24 domain
MLSHHDIWRAIDRLAQKNGLSPSGLARKAGLSPTLFNPSKRVNGTRKRWPSTESISAILKATDCSLDSFVALASEEATQHSSLPFLSCTQAAKEKGLFDEQGLPNKKMWDEMPLPAARNNTAFALEITKSSATEDFEVGTCIILDPDQTPRHGDWVGLQLKSGDILIKRLGSSGAQKVELHDSSPDEPPLTLARHEISWLYRIIWASK